MYPKVIHFTYQGKDEFKTLFGGIVSLIIKIFIIAIALSLIITIIQRGNSSYSINTVFKDNTDSEDIHYFAKNDVYFAF